MTDRALDSFKTKSELTAAGKTYSYFSLPKLAAAAGKDLAKLPFSLRILLENLLRKFHPQVLLVVGNPSIQQESALRDLASHADSHEFAVGVLGDSADELRGLLARGIRAWGQAPVYTRVISLIEEAGA